MTARYLMACLILAVSLAACQAMVPQGTAPANPSVFSPPAAQKDAASDSGDAPATDVPSDTGATGGTGGVSAVPSPTSMDPVAINDKPHPGGVSALPADVGGGDAAKTAFDFTLSGTADPACTEPPPDIDRMWFGGRGPVRYYVTGTLGAVLLDGTPVPLNGCGQVALRVQEGTGPSAHCEDVRVKENCQFNMHVSLRHVDQARIYLYAHWFDPGFPIPPDYQPCGEMEEMLIPQKNDVTFAPARDAIPVCQPLKIDGTFQKTTNFLGH